MKKIDPDSLKENLEKSTDDFRHNRYQVLYQISEEYKKQERFDDSKFINFESGAFALIVDVQNKDFPGYFQPMIRYTNGITIPPIDFFSKECLDYLEGRAFSTKNPIISARFCDVVWDFRKNNIELAENAIKGYLECANIFKKNSWGIEYATAISRAAYLASSINNSDLIESVKVFCLKELEYLSKDNDYRFCIDIAKAIANSKINLNGKQQEIILDILQKGIKFYTSEHDHVDKKLGPSKGPNHHLSNSINETIILLNSKKKINVNGNEIKEKMADSFESEGDDFFNKKNYLGAIMSFVKSEKIYQELGLTEKMNALRKKIQNAGILNYENLSEISIKQTIEKDKLDQYLNPLIGKDVRESLKSLSSAPHFVPNLKNIQDFTAEINEKFALQAIIPKVILDDEGAVRVSSKDDDIRDISTIQNLILDINIGNIFLHELFNRLKNEQKMKSSDILQHFEEWGYANKDNISILAKGFDLYLNDDYLSSIHLLVFQFEDLLRNLLKAAGIPVITPNKYVTLESLIKNELFLSVAGKNLIRYYEIVLIEPNGINLRNEIAHGLLPKKEMNEYNIERIIHVLLTLTKFKVKEHKGT
jgi:hypothetical protein